MRIHEILIETTKTGLYHVSNDQNLNIKKNHDLQQGQMGRGFCPRPRATQTPAFKQWFGNSKVVDHNGDPLVVYHGTGEDFDIFNTNGRGKTHGTGVFFSSNPDTASTYSLKNGNVMPLFLSLQNPAVIDAGGMNWCRMNKKTRAALPAIEVSDQEDEDLLAALGDREPRQGVTKKLKARNTTLGRIFPDELRYHDDFTSTDDLARWARKQGYDGLIITNVRDRGPSGAHATESSRDPHDLYVVFSPSQIKSAIGNNGNFSATIPRVVENTGRPILETFGAPYNVECVRQTDQQEEWKFKTEHGQHYRIHLKMRTYVGQKVAWLVFETYEGSTMATGTADAFRVFATVISVFKDFIKRSEPKMFSFAGKGPTRKKLYDAFARKISVVFPEYYLVRSEEEHGTTEYIFSKNSK